MYEFVSMGPVMLNNTTRAQTILDLIALEGDNVEVVDIVNILDQAEQRGREEARKIEARVRIDLLRELSWEFGLDGNHGMAADFELRARAIEQENPSSSDAAQKGEKNGK